MEFVMLGVTQGTQENRGFLSCQAWEREPGFRGDGDSCPDGGKQTEGPGGTELARPEEGPTWLTRKSTQPPNKQHEPNKCWVHGQLNR